MPLDQRYVLLLVMQNSEVSTTMGLFGVWPQQANSCMPPVLHDIQASADH